MHKPKNNQNGQLGFSLVEVLVAMLIGLLGLLMIMQIFAVNETYKSHTSETNSAQNNGAIALFSVERDLKMAGYAIANSAALGCSPLRYFYNGDYSVVAGGSLPNVQFRPVVITQGTSAPDSVVVMYAGTAYRFAPASLSATMSSAQAAFSMDDVTGYKAGDFVVATSGTTCSLSQITTVVASSQSLQHVSTSLFNPSAGTTLTAFITGSQLFNLGTPVVRTFSIVGDNLQASDWLANVQSAGSGDQVVMNQVVDLQAEYGMDNGSNNGSVSTASYIASDGVIDSFSTTVPATVTAWQQTLAVRFAVLARGVYEKPNSAGTCTATVSPPTWQGGAMNVPEGLPSCFRYRVFETTVPLRNMIWRDS